MKKTILFLFLLTSLSALGQRSRNIGRVPANTEPTEQEIEKREREMEERREEYVLNFLSTLEADDFQKQILKQKIYSFFEAKIAIFKTQFEHSLDRKEAIKKLEETHFKELEELISENDMKKIKEMIKGDFDEKDVIKDKKKKKRKKRKDKDN
ncbi:hypothetical protein [Winogradskyella sp. SYSU M77433]|uniref:hypothetical protein n=1 Tax=Winogradskyella sp. SYSU M77433 TaxID=3042722 RepID=UPI002480B1D8|nr:hypothetical protein [Winogradskyella sp. SYSU M77433]MDH7912630.1 hypothetical protein [Winogradskyella sp. SYSU M77433]